MTLTVFYKKKYEKRNDRTVLTLFNALDGKGREKIYIDGQSYPDEIGVNNGKNI